ncbi:1-aminocyclopropane-1-carboxylate deaminase/D-cysteine desulfhydrase [Gilvibacter sediminis]|uniref:1-aminocyclopropane-1-carboxylate deaminase/D-cysteine desulfhydrase n=1 Tax=Gilvibacter sediminis TaxID=379071 RepID=UPI00234FEE46|nr:pyridoxal-phosphate dependent enzyme [Gilvibacter sediminis]MDC7997521.1 pyridoxal-phosphate dependent enzyme [Gilvibacter sediminis]
MNDIKAQITPLISAPNGAQLDLLREDLLGGAVQGNKYRKLHYNLQHAQELGAQTLLSFGGAYSNHIAALAAAAASIGMRSIGIIRGEELQDKWEENPTLGKAVALGMELIFVSRAEYRLRNQESYLIELQEKYPEAYIIPEGGTNDLALQGCREILGAHTQDYDCICVPVGTGGTLAGISQAAMAHQKLIGFPALKGDFMVDGVAQWTTTSNWELNTDYAFGGYGKITAPLIAFINQFKQAHGIALDPVYTGKMLFGLFELLKADRFPEKSRILAVHTGGLQGIAGMRQKIAQKGLPPLEI